MFTIDKQLSKVSGCVARESMRYAINGVQLEPQGESGGLAVATDGRRLVAVQTQRDGDAGDDHALIVRGDDWKALTRTLRRKAMVAKVGNGKPDTLSVVDGAGMTDERELVCGKFPVWRDVVPGQVSISIAVNPKLLIGLLKAMPTSEDGRKVTLHLTDNLSQSPLVVTSGDGEREAVGLLMPIQMYDQRNDGRKIKQIAADDQRRARADYVAHRARVLAE